MTTQGPDDRIDSFVDQSTDDDTKVSEEGIATRTEEPGGSSDSSSETGKAADIGFIGLLRWAWRQLTTMRVALMLLFMLALAVIPGSVLPQQIQDPAAVNSFIEDNGVFGQVLDSVQLFDVYGSVWFSAIYILLLVSLVGCIIPRTKVHWRAMRSAPPKAPKRLSRMPAHDTSQVEAEADDVLDAAEALFKKRGYRVARSGDSVAAEKGYLRETGNLVFHVALLGTVITMAVGGLWGYSGQRVLVEGDTFSNSLVSYDSFNKGAFFNPDNLDDFTMTLDEFDATFDSTSEGNQYAQPRDFEARVTTNFHGVEEERVLRVNEPVRMGGANVYLPGNGYAPVITVRDANGDVAFSGPVVFLPQDGVYTSRGVIKAPDAQPEQLGLVGIFFPTAGQDENGQIISTFPDLANPYLVLSAFKGDLGLDAGVSQSVYELDPENMTQLADENGDPVVLQLAPGESTQLPDGSGTVSFDGVKRFMAVDIRHDPAQVWMILFATLIVLGLSASLFIPRRRAWVRASEGDEGTTVEVASLARGDDPRLEAETLRLAVELRKAL